MRRTTMRHVLQFATLLACASSSANPSPMEQLDAYLNHHGIPSLPILSVRYNDTELHGQHLYNGVKGRPRNEMLKSMPTVTWDASIQCAMLLFVDIDAGGRPTNDSQAGPMGPYVHSLWTHCRGGTASECSHTLKNYLPPGSMNARPNRYAYVLFSHPCAAEIKLPTRYKFGKDKLSFDRLLNENVGLSARAATFMNVGREKKRRLADERASAKPAASQQELH